MTPVAKKSVEWTVFGAVIYGGTLLSLMAFFGYAAFGQVLCISAHSVQSYHSVDGSSHSFAPHCSHVCLHSTGAGTKSLLHSTNFRSQHSIPQSCESDIMVNFNVSYSSVQFALLVVCLHLLFYIPNDFIIMRLFFLEAFDVNPLRMPFNSFAAVTLVRPRVCARACACADVCACVCVHACACVRARVCASVTGVSLATNS